MAHDFPISATRTNLSKYAGKIRENEKCKPVIIVCAMRYRLHKLIDAHVTVNTVAAATAYLFMSMTSKP